MHVKVGKIAPKYHSKITFCIKTSQTVAVPGHPGNMTSGFNFRNRPFERNPTTWVPTAPMRNGKNSTFL